MVFGLWCGFLDSVFCSLCSDFVCLQFLINSLLVCWYLVCDFGFVYLLFGLFV